MPHAVGVIFILGGTAGFIAAIHRRARPRAGGLIRRAGVRFQFHMDATKMKRGPERRRGVGVQHTAFHACRRGTRLRLHHLSGRCFVVRLSPRTIAQFGQAVIM